KDATHAISVKVLRKFDTFDRLVQSITNEAGNTVVYDLRHRASPVSNHRGAARHGLDHYQTEWLRPVYRENEGDGVAYQLILFVLTYLSHELYERVIEKRHNLLHEVRTVRRAYFCSNLEFDARAFCDLNSPVNSLLR